ncbi:hypothetical protein L2E82_06733 [Cichorium intybus]|uniref:Uncharacterized protein n=1 Tax=Cichorium intybus TaxID=13427 RepID=A0ACB9HBA4_CICIN|nr:hypothetical protein L2E82_06733 [Cichorium intybus]
MINNGNIDNSSVNQGDRDQSLSTSEKGFMEMEGRVYSDFYRNTSEDMFIRTLMESPVGMPAPTMEMLGFKNLSSNFRADSEELFKNWLTTGENQGHNPSTLVHNRSRQLSRRLLADQASQQNGVSFEGKTSNENLIPQSSLAVGESSNDVNDLPVRNVAERGMQASNLYLAKAWFHSSQPMTRSRSSELRRRYVAMQNSQTAIGMEATGNRVNQLKQQFVNQSQFNEASLYHTNGFMPPSNSSSSNINELQFGTIDKVSSVVSMLKGTLERKKLNNQIEKEAIEAIEDDSLGYYSTVNHVNEIQNYQVQGGFQDLSNGEMKDPGLFQIVQGGMDADMDNFVAPTSNVQMSFASREASQSESSPVISNGFDACDGQSNSGQTPSACESSRKQVGIAKSLGAREQMYDNLQEDHKQKRSLIRFGSVTSAASVDSRDPTKKRRVERSRKMAEAKGRTQTPANSTDMQSILKRCENLEKEVRSLKLNLAFMNRKDSEQTKQIEELQKQHEEMRDEKERLLEEIERILSEPDKI